jgi:hypothetical protein
VHHHQLVGVREGQRLEEQPVDEREDCRIGADAERERDDG